MSIVTATKAIELLNSEKIVALPTETVYGLAGQVNSNKAIESIFITKKRPSFDPLIVHAANIDQAKTCVSEWNPVLQILAEEFWPGPLTLIAPKGPHISDTITAGLNTVGVRCPDHKVTLHILKTLSAPIAAPSANIFSRTSPTSAEHVEKEFSGMVPVVDGGSCHVGLESTICRVENWDGNNYSCQLQILRPGAVLSSDIKKTLSNKGWSTEFVSADIQITAPGQLKVHYRPAIPLVLVKTLSLSDEKVLQKTSEKLNVKNAAWLQLNDHPALAARRLYSQLRELGQGSATVIICRWSPQWTSELWQSIDDRLSRAAHLII